MGYRETNPDPYTLLGNFNNDAAAWTDYTGVHSRCYTDLLVLR
jgi:hypothetical protein